MIPPHAPGRAGEGRPPPDTHTHMRAHSLAGGQGQVVCVTEGVLGKAKNKAQIGLPEKALARDKGLKMFKKQTLPRTIK